MQGIPAFFEHTYDYAVNYGIPFIITLSIVVFVHEFGHFWVARRCGVKVLSFSIGMGPEIFGFTDKTGTRWRFSLFPIGGYVQMFGDADPASATVDEQAKAMPEAERRYAFFAQNVYKRIAIIFAGPAMNYIFAFVVLFGMYSLVGQPYQLPIIDSVVEKSAAAEAGLKPGDRILAVDGEKIAKFSELVDKTMASGGKTLQLAVQRGDEALTVAVTPRMTEVQDKLGHQVSRPKLGITRLAKTEGYEKMGVGEAFTQSISYIVDFTDNTLTTIWEMLTGKRGTEDLGGPLRIAQISGEVAKTRDVGIFMDFLVKISISLGFVNLLPIPLLDGGHIFFYLLEAVRRRPMSERFREYASRVGLGIVLSVMIFALWNDSVAMHILPR